MKNQISSHIRNFSTRTDILLQRNRKNIEWRDPRTSFDKFMPQTSRVKAWEKKGQDKETYFKKNFAHIHANTKESDPYNKKLHHREKLQSIRDELSEQHLTHLSKFKGSRNVMPSLKPNPLSDYVYGTNSVIAALNSKKRAYHMKLLYYGTLSPVIARLATQIYIPMEKATKHQLNLLTNNGIHNNVVLETKPIETIEVSHLKSCDDESGVMRFDETIAINLFEENQIRYDNKTKTYPLGIFLDQIMDPHNMGAIIRSAYFLGVDFILISRRNSSPLSPVVSKSSSGALELIPILTVDRPLDFVNRTKQANDWTFITTDSNPNARKEFSPKALKLADLKGQCNEAPTILIVGNEGKGVRTNMKFNSDFIVEIPFKERPRSKNEIRGGGGMVVDSLNVSVATALLIDNILRK
ncbi:hypothetical protein TBLA_0B04220 [Henningerozyma blattae CBS 6284]|uniref:rRNA methyltransferase 1, mitochondrial n=1 Tax=Henningerozyma blattae (strain ATCC 34711 / CBS 6284 / DSM 70876 / NBRC 10599 / NRRL Y-10934 / UCD 77-7) TaxID=1071380 RepID=I2GYQ8_HENB6|nr:hypothetical protein TBLA_0B04220 [Tetrapisispora blattae CBS 6284]CCH59260.1 hypothetical protein TBLA_0B04220 [Tetrapisispora blattae CBS 6284]